MCNGSVFEDYLQHSVYDTIPHLRCVDSESKQIVMWLPVLSLVRNTEQTLGHSSLVRSCTEVCLVLLTNERTGSLHYQHILN